ncbi:hypothetical protein L596_004653 [Steinernema carpocapsae]|uniref:Uncharacterized protein n=1 Tax=Steinernema carpocapsae TaxID=34508 RepID=A0A4U8UXJ4_STECR|nr:hypothetical protein L596_004653 [Steinernema carpocapsae]
MSNPDLHALFSKQHSGCVSFGCLLDSPSFSNSPGSPLPRKVVSRKQFERRSRSLYPFPIAVLIPDRGQRKGVWTRFVIRI